MDSSTVFSSAFSETFTSGTPASGVFAGAGCTGLELAWASSLISSLSALAERVTSPIKAAFSNILLSDAEDKK